MADAGLFSFLPNVCCLKVVRAVTGSALTTRGRLSATGGFPFFLPKAYGSAGYAPKNADVCASRLLVNVKVADAIAEKTGKPQI
jgi:hypothetical protein